MPISKTGESTMENKRALFRGSGIRKTFQNNEWWFVIDDGAGSFCKEIT